MPVIEVENTENHKVGLWKITENVAELGLKVVATTTGLELRDLHLLSSRALLQELCANPNLNWSKTQNGKPILLDGDGHISLSHSGWYSAAIVSSEPSGIDIEKMNDRILRIAPKFINDREKRELTTDSLLHHYLIWCVKECIFKWYGVGGVDFRKHLYVDIKSLHSGHIRAEMNKQGKHVNFLCKFMLPEPEYLLVWIHQAEQ